MSQPSPGVSELDARLAEIDRRLREIQAGLEPDLIGGAPDSPPPRDPPPPAASEPASRSDPPPETTPGHPPPVVPEPRLPPVPGPASNGEPPRSPRSGPLAALLARSRRRRADPADEMATLVRMHNGLLEAVGDLVRLLGAQAPALPHEQSGGVVSAGPFTTPEQVESFVTELAELEPVREVSLLGYEGADRALIEVQLGGSSG